MQWLLSIENKKLRCGSMICFKTLGKIGDFISPSVGIFDSFYVDNVILFSPIVSFHNTEYDCYEWNCFSTTGATVFSFWRYNTENIINVIY